MARRKQRFVYIPFTAQVALATLNDNTVLSAGLFGTVLVEDLYFHRIDATWSIRDLTPGEGPIEVGLNHGDYTNAEILEALDANLFDPTDLVAAEQAGRKVRRVGKFSGALEAEVLNDGKPIRRAIRFKIGSTKEMEMFAVNRSGANLTTGAILDVEGVVIGKWLV